MQPIPPQTQEPVDSVHKQIRQRIVDKKMLAVVLFLAMAMIGLIVFAILRQPNDTKNFIGSDECISLVQQKEGANFSGIHNLTCTVTPRSVANESIGAQYLEYSGTPVDESICIDPFMAPEPDFQATYCVQFSGIVTSDGKFYTALGSLDSQVPIEYDYCYGLRSGFASKIVPTTHDIYRYQGELYDRDIYEDTAITTPFGTCVLNGTTLYRPDTDGNIMFISNVSVDYVGFPKDCSSIMIGRPIHESLHCEVMLTAANASLDTCYTNRSPIVENGVVAGYKTEYQLYVGQYVQGDCEDVYVQRMAALGRCQEIVDAKFQADCTAKITQPFERVTRVTSAL